MTASAARVRATKAWKYVSQGSAPGARKTSAAPGGYCQVTSSRGKAPWSELLVPVPVEGVHLAGDAAVADAVDEEQTEHAEAGGCPDGGERRGGGRVRQYAAPGMPGAGEAVPKEGGGGGGGGPIRWVVIGRYFSPRYGSFSS